MNRLNSGWAVLILGLGAALASAQPEEKPDGDERDSSHKHWKWVFELRLPEKLDGRLVALPITPEVFGKSGTAVLGDGQREGFNKFQWQDFDNKMPVNAFGNNPNELSDLRLADALGNPVPFALRIMRDQFQRVDMNIIRTFNAAPDEKRRVFEASYELAVPPPPGYNEIEIRTTGRNFRRKVEVFGDDTDQFLKPRSILGKGKYLVHYEVDGKIVDVHRFPFALMQYRYLQVRVHADDVTVDKEIPKITSVAVRRTIEVPGEYVSMPANLAGPESVRGDGGPATAWTITLPDRMPCEKLTFEVFGELSERPMRLEFADPNQPRQTIGGVDWRWRRPEPRPGDDKQPEQRAFLDARFNEIVARRFRIVVTDFANPPLNITGNVQVTSCMRKLIFENPVKTALPLRLFTGNPSIGPANYVLDQKLPTPLPAGLPMATLDVPQPNPAYEEPPIPLHERAPWLVHLVLGLSSLVLLAILAALARQAIHRHDNASAATGVVPPC